MEIEEIIKALEGKEIGADVVSAVKGLDQSGEVERLKQAVTDAEGKASGILADKKRYKEERDAHKTALDKIETDKLPTEEQHAKAMKELQDQLEQSQADRAADAEKTAKTERDSAITDLTGSIQWGKNMPRDSAKLLVKNALTGVDDLSDKTKVGDALKALTDAHKPFIDAEVPAGTGGSGSGGGGGGAGGNEPSSMKGIMEEVWSKK